MDREYYAVKDGKKLRCGYTTGTCATAAASAAAMMLFSHRNVDTVRVETPKGVTLDLETEDAVFSENTATCAVRKDAGDDPDITDGLLIFATVTYADGDGIILKGGKGVGTVTKEGMSSPVGEAAINPTPRRMITEAVRKVMDDFKYKGGLEVTISIPGGEELARKTFNPRLGIVGGLSVLGTSGIVDPMSEQALIDTIHVEMNSRRAAGDEHLLAFFGNYGVDFAASEWQMNTQDRVTCSNYVGEMLDYAAYLQFKDVLLIGHVGKMLKLSQGIMNTHSRYGDGRTTFLAMEAMFAGACVETGKAVYESLTTDMALDILEKAGVLEPVLQKATEKVAYYMQARVHGALKTEAVLFSNKRGIMGMTQGATELIRLHGGET